MYFFIKYLRIWHFFCIFALKMVMHTLKHYILIIVGILIPVVLGAQNGTSSPFSRTAYGELNDNVPITYRAMGGVGIGMRSNKVISSLQPASYTACDSLTFMFDLGASAMWSRYGQGDAMKNNANGNLEYISLQMPLFKRYIALSAGVLPYSAVGYNITLQDSIRSDYHFQKAYQGEGGISEVYGGLSFNIMDWFAIGANVYYMFGNVTNTRTLTFREPELTAVAMVNAIKVNSVRFRFGAQFFHEFENHAFVLGAIFENKTNLRCTYGEIESSLLDSVYVSDDDPNFKSELPMQYGVGLSYTWAKRLTIAADFSRQCFSQVSYMTQGSGVLKDRNKYCFGMEYRHNPFGRNYAERMQWRLGCNMSDSYVQTINTPDFSVSMGFGFPLRNAGTIFNSTIEYGHRGDIGGMEEHFLRLSLNASISENWFFKRKL